MSGPTALLSPYGLRCAPNRFLLPDSKTGETVFSPSVKNGVTSSVYRANASTPAVRPLTITSAAVSFDLFAEITYRANVAPDYIREGMNTL